jgi:hypothetical protein
VTAMFVNIFRYLPFEHLPIPEKVPAFVLDLFQSYRTKTDKQKPCKRQIT